jgi:hypothetical protein
MDGHRIARFLARSAGLMLAAAGLGAVGGAVLGLFGGAAFWLLGGSPTRGLGVAWLAVSGAITGLMVAACRVLDRAFDWPEDDWPPLSEGRGLPDPGRAAGARRVRVDPAELHRRALFPAREGVPAETAAEGDPRGHGPAADR